MGHDSYRQELPEFQNDRSLQDQADTTVVAGQPQEIKLSLSGAIDQGASVTCPQCGGNRWQITATAATVYGKCLSPNCPGQFLAVSQIGLLAAENVIIRPELLPKLARLRLMKSRYD